MPRQRKPQIDAESAAEDAEIAPTEGEQAQLIRAGKSLQRIRTNLGLEQREVEDRTAELGYKVVQQQLPKIEKGRIARPSFRDVVMVGRVYGLTPNQMAEMFGYWDAVVENDPWEITVLRSVLNRITPYEKERLLQFIGAVTSLVSTGAFAPK